jgi:hypothetical protein
VPPPGNRISSYETVHPFLTSSGGALEEGVRFGRAYRDAGVIGAASIRPAGETLCGCRAAIRVYGPGLLPGHGLAPYRFQSSEVRSKTKPLLPEKVLGITGAG